MEKKLKRLINKLLDTAHDAAGYQDESRRNVATSYAYAAERLIVVLIQWQQHEDESRIKTKE